MVTPISTLPAAPNPDDAAGFDVAAFAWASALPNFVSQANALASAMSSFAAGGAMTIPYLFSTTTADADPTAGRLRLDNATQNTATTIRTDLLGYDGSTVTAVLDTFDDSTSSVKGFILLQSVTDASKWLLFSVSSMGSPSGYRNITVANVASSSASPFADGELVVLKFSRTGDKGTTGDTGLTGANGGLPVLAVLTPTAAANVDALNVFSATYDNYLVIAEGVKPGTADQLRIRLAASGAADTGSNYYGKLTEASPQTTTSDTSAQISGTIPADGIGLNFVMHIVNVNSAASLKSIHAKVVYQSQTGGSPGYVLDGAQMGYSAANAVTGLRLFWGGGANFAASGKIRIYAYNNT